MLLAQQCMQPARQHTESHQPTALTAQPSSAHRGRSGPSTEGVAAHRHVAHPRAPGWMAAHTTQIRRARPLHADGVPWPVGIAVPGHQLRVCCCTPYHQCWYPVADLLLGDALPAREFQSSSSRATAKVHLWPSPRGCRSSSSS